MNQISSVKLQDRGNYLLVYTTDKAYSLKHLKYFEASHRTLLLPETHCLWKDIECTIYLHYKHFKFWLTMRIFHAGLSATHYLSLLLFVTQDMSNGSHRSDIPSHFLTQILLSPSRLWQRKPKHTKKKSQVHRQYSAVDAEEREGLVYEK